MSAENFIVTTFYKFFEEGALVDVASMQVALYKICKNNNILGTILLADEGINSTLTGTREDLDSFYNEVGRIPELADLYYKESACSYRAFDKLKVKIKPEIIRFEVDALDARDAGERLSPQEWEALIDRGVMMIDTRNYYEVAFGTFKNAVNPNINNFTDLVAWLDDNLKDADKEQPVAMFCTGGVRCEKSTAYLKNKGFKKVYHLNGGILQYLQMAEKKRDYWHGQCFVFDNRVAVDHDLQPYMTDSQV